MLGWNNILEPYIVTVHIIQMTFCVKNLLVVVFAKLQVKTSVTGTYVRACKK